MTKCRKMCFRDQAIKASSQLVGKRFASYGKYVKKVVPDSKFDQAVDGAFTQVAKLANGWSQLDLPNQYRFADIGSISDEERRALANDIANQNRALATLGSVSVLAGWAGILADTLWLLLVSLRTIYQLAVVYDKPLTGKQGIKMAYEVLATADLSKMQEKQALLAGLSVGKGLMDNAAQNGLHNELNNLGLKNKNVNYYAEQVDQIAQQFNIDLDQMNLTWLRRLLPIGSVAIGMHYNSQLIDQVIGVAQATFAPEPKLTNNLLANEKNGVDGTDAADTLQADLSKEADAAAAKMNESQATDNTP